MSKTTDRNHCVIPHYRGLQRTVNSCLLLVSLIASHSALAMQTSYSYNDKGRILTIDGPRVDVTDITTYGYSDSGQRTSITNAAGHVFQLSHFNGLGLPQRLTDANNIVSTLTYHRRGWLTSITIVSPTGNTALDSTTTYTYDAVGLLIKVTSPDNQFLSYQYDAARRLTEISNNTGEKILYTLDAAGNRTSTTINGANSSILYTATQTFDELSRTMEVIGAGSETAKLEYDSNNNVTSSINPKNYTTESHYDPLNRLTSTVDPDLGRTEFTYDTQNRLTSVTDAIGRVTTYEYDAFDNLISQDSTATGVTTYEYDEAGNRVYQKTVEGDESRYQYDSLNRLTQYSYPNDNPYINGPTEDVIYQYDNTNWCPKECTGQSHFGIGKLTSVIDGSTSTYYRYDHLGNVIEKVLLTHVNHSRDKRFTTKYSYNNANQLEQMTYPSGLVVLYQRDALGRIQQISYQKENQNSEVLASSISYLPFGPVKSIVYNNGLTTHNIYDQNYRITNITAGDKFDLSYQYDQNSNIIEIFDKETDPNSDINQHRAAQNETPDNLQQLSYDPLDRLQTNDNNRGDNTFSYDQVGNRLSHEYSETIASPVEDKKAYDLTYSKNNRLTGVSGSNQSHGYFYTPQGQRFLKRGYEAGQDVEDHYIYNNAGNLLSEQNKQDEFREYIYLNQHPIALITATDVYYYHNDHLGTPRMLTNQAQERVWAADYTAFGKALITTETITNNLRFAGQYFDVESGFHYNWFRYYDPKIGRYLRSDPIGLAGGINTYAYVGGNPLSYVDPMGLKSCVLVTRNSWGFGNHAAFYVDRGESGSPFLYDPGGSYAQSNGSGSGQFLDNEYASISKFSEWHKNDTGDTTEVACKDTTEEQEKQFAETAVEWGGQTGGFCSSTVSALIGGSEHFNKVESPTWLPGDLMDAVRNSPIPRVMLK